MGAFLLARFPGGYHVRSQRLARISIALAAALGSSQALAENWVTVYEGEILWLDVDKDSIRRGNDNLVYYQLKNLVKTDRAVDCQKRMIYTLKIHAPDQPDFPNWRDEGWVAEADSSAEAELEYVCANVEGRRFEAV